MSMSCSEIRLSRHATLAMVRRRHLACTLFTWCAVVALPADALADGIKSDNSRRSALDRAMEAESVKYFQSSCHVGLSVAIVKPEGTFYYDYGAATRDGPKLANSRSLYEIASVTKVFTAALAASAVIDKRITLDGDFRSYLPNAYSNLASEGQPITLRWLVTHRSGMPRDIPDTDAIFAKNDLRTRPYELIANSKGYDHGRTLSALHDMRLQSVPGEREAYSNVGFLVIGFGLETVYAEPVERLMSRMILNPLRMTSTGFSVGSDDRYRLVRGYDRYGRAMPNHPSNAGAAWGLYSTTEDMARFVSWQLDERDPVVEQSHQLLLGNARNGVAMAWHLAFEDDQPMLWHGGGSFGMSAQLVLFPQQGEGYVLLANDTCEATESALANIAISLHGRVRSDAVQTRCQLES